MKETPHVSNLVATGRIRFKLKLNKTATISFSKREFRIQPAALIQVHFYIT
jgi:hypothetical protein